jgi:hypothetical protein
MVCANRLVCINWHIRLLMQVHFARRNPLSRLLQFQTGTIHHWWENKS